MFNMHSIFLNEEICALSCLRIILINTSQNVICEFRFLVRVAAELE